MSTYPGQGPDDDQPRDQDAPAEQRPDDEPTAPITPSGPVANPSSAQFEGAQQPQEHPHSPQGAPYQQHPAGWHVPPPTTPYPQGPQGVGQYGGWAPPAPDHPQATTAMIVGILGLVLGFSFCGLGFLASPFAWAIGRNALREIEASPGRYGGASQARTGLYTGIAGTVLLVLALLLFVLFAIFLVIGAATSTGEI